MSYDVQLFRIETKEKHLQSSDEDFFGNENNFVPFSPEQKEELKARLLQYDFSITREDEHGIHFERAGEFGITALLTNSGVWFSAVFNADAIFEVGMTASEFTDTDEFAKYDPQNEGWEEV